MNNAASIDNLYESYSSGRSGDKRLQSKASRKRAKLMREIRKAGRGKAWATN